MEDKKTSITLSAIKAFKEKGIEHTTISDIVKYAGIAQGTFYLYFPSKLSVMPEIAIIMVEKILEELKNHVNISDTFDIKLKKIIEVIFNLTEEYKDIYALIYSGLASSEYLVHWENIYEKYYEAIGGILSNAQDKVEIRSTINPKRYAAILIGLIEASAEKSFLYNEQDEKIIELKKSEVFDFAFRSLTQS
ncbi:AcrR family transcriptional regulator [Virgibacillus halotolerans]|uniref:TetR family transcriptional regulator n=1 Tax=Virgibacillus halotolerans TaxID=1071053 RepID=UPI00195F7956|nr:TetR family transcriptional regulator [Virgibacillus halotolerans]MBM7598993.1 AcrR family transcriptional regulator [Virgibacillus halotolerans]